MRSSCAIATLLIALLAPLQADAQQGDEPAPAAQRRYGKAYNGAFVDFSVRVARTHVTSAPFNGWSFDAGLRQALVMHLLDTRLSYAEDRWSAREGAAGDFVARSVNIHGAFHPLYLALLLSDWFGYVLASFYVEAGLGAQIARETNLEVNDLGLRFSLGTGFDVPLSDPDRGWSIWLNALYRYTWADFDYDSGGETNLYHHAGWLGVSLRFNGLLF